jgi:molecular chaperone GrpE (heat shock protein)
MRLFRRARHEPVAAASDGDVNVDVDVDVDVEQLSKERAALVDLCMQLDDLVRSEALREKIRRRLSEVGVDVIDPAGAAFDPDTHVAVGSEATESADEHGRVAYTSHAGFRDHAAELRRPEVVVYRIDSPS